MAMTKTGDAEQTYLTGTPDSTTVWEKHEWVFNSNGLKLKTGSAGAFLEWSFDGKEVHGRMLVNEAQDFVDFHKGKIWVRGDSPSQIWAWL